MVSSNKVLTVSYGTFSCTLEGFDESFETMKAIAEYFRDLAADDRYFGAEPPTPDADMLARIAEREISRRVRAHEEGGQIVLRAGDTEAFVKAGAGQAAAAPEQAAPEAASEETASEEPAEETADAPAETDREPDDTASAEAEGPEVQPQEPAPQDTAAPEATTGRDAVAEEETAAPEFPDTRQDAEDRHDVTAGDMEAEDIVAEDTDGDSVAARLRRIRSVVAESGGRYGPDDYDEDEHAQDFLTQTAAELEDALEADAAPQVTPVEQDHATAGQAATAHEAKEGVGETSDDPFASLTARLLETDAEADATAADTPETDEATPDTTPDETAEDDIPEEPATGTETDEDTLAQLLADAMPDEAEPGDAAAQEAEAETDAPLVLGADEQLDDFADAARGTDNLFQEDHAGTDPVRDDADDTQEVARLSPEEEAELMQELAAVEAELGAGSPGDEPAGDEGDTTPDAAAADADADRDAGDDAGATEDEAADSEAESEARHTAAHLEMPQEDSDVSRLFDEADSQLDAPEASKRRNAIQHLRAAVAATRAEKKAGRELREESSDAPYRSDLASVVRPRRPRAGESSGSTERPRARRPHPEDRPAPLKLVAEQRVDTPREPVRPRRVSTAQLAAESNMGDDGGFSEYAERIGATDLPELLEAAAAYMADVEGRDQFSRPMLMGKLKEAGHEDFSREDGLRSFGNLLREGKLRKLKGGRFAVTDQTEFRPRPRHAG